MNGRDQVAAMSVLSAWKPDRLGPWSVGDYGQVPGLGVVQVVELKPPSELLVRVQSGKVCRIGWRAAKKIGREE